jgi:hypothetical protein
MICHLGKIYLAQSSAIKVDVPVTVTDIIVTIVTTTHILYTARQFTWFSEE